MTISNEQASASAAEKIAILRGVGTGKSAVLVVVVRRV
jgi:hypothetical protein